MADFTVNLTGPQGAGATPVAPVQEQVIPDGDNKLLSGIVDIFAKGLVADNKSKALERKNAVVGEYVKNEGVYSDALVTGQWGASQVGSASRANFNKMIASYPEYATELMEARKAVYDGTETGEAQKKVDAEIAFRQKEKERASAAGYTFFSGMSPATEEKTIAASQATVRINAEFDAVVKRNAEQRAQAGEGRAVQNHTLQIQDYQDKQNAVKGLLEIADRNFDSLNGMANDLLNDPSKSFEERLALYDRNVQRIKTGMVAISAKNPEMAAPWQRLIDDMQGTFTKLADPKNKTESELAALKTQFETQQYKAKLLITADPSARAAVAVTSLFPNNPALMTLATDPVVKGILAQYGMGPLAGQNAPAVVGTPNEKGALKMIKNALNLMQSGKANGDPAKNSEEAVNTVNEVLKQTGQMDTGLPASTLKELGSFYSSPEFGKLSAEGKIDMPTMQNAKRVFQVAYEPAVRDAVTERLTSIGTASRLDFQVSGGQVVISSRAPSDKRSVGQMIGGAFNIEKGLQGNTSNADVAAIKEAAGGLNTLVKIGAHMSGTTDYAKYWEDNKHFLLPTVFPDPAKLKVGQTIKATNGKSYKYIGGNFNDIANSYTEVPSAGRD